MLDALDQYVALEVDVRLYLASANGVVLEPAPDDVAQFEQTGATLGARMKQAFADTLAAGYEHAVIIGTDHPTLPSPFIEQAFQALETPASIVLGPSTDGGYYLLGMNDFYPQLFDDMAYSHGEVFADTLDRAAQTGAHLTILPSWYDVDEPDDLKRLARDLDANPDQTPRTRAKLESMLGRIDERG